MNACILKMNYDNIMYKREVIILTIMTAVGLLTKMIIFMDAVDAVREI